MRRFLVLFLVVLFFSSVLAFDSMAVVRKGSVEDDGDVIWPEVAGRTFIDDEVIGGEECVLKRAYWEREDAVDGERVDMVVESEGCLGMQAEFVIYESDGILGRQEVDRVEGVVDGDVFRIGWVSEYVGDVFGNPEYEFDVSVNPEMRSENLLEVGGGDGDSASLVNVVAVGDFARIGKGCTTAYYIDKDCDGYGVGVRGDGIYDIPGLVGDMPDADDEDFLVNTPESVLSKYGTIQNFLAVAKGHSANTIYYVHPDGDDLNDCSVNRPCKTWGRVDDVLGAGDVLVYRGGIYYDDVHGSIFALYNPYDGGDLDNPVLIMAYPGERVVLDAVSAYVNYGTADWMVVDGFVINNSRNAPWGHGIILGETSNSIFRNNEIVNFNWPSGMQDMHNLTVENNIFHDMLEHGLYMGARELPNSNLTIRGNIIYRCGVSAGYGAFQHNGRVTDMVFENNILHSTGKWGISLKMGVSNSTFKNNLIFNNDGFAIILDNYDGNCLAGGVICPYDMKYNNFVNNLVWVGKYKAWSERVSAGFVSGVVFSDRSTWDNSSLDYNSFRNNIFVTEGGPVFKYNDPKWLNTTTIENNVIYRRRGDERILDYFGLFFNFAEFEANSSLFRNNKFDWPLFGDVSVDYFASPENFSFDHVSGSPAIDFGISTDAPDFDLRGDVRPRGNGVDAGCYESGFSGEILVETCEDGLKNQDEIGVDCGGVCPTSCNEVTCFGLEGDVCSDGEYCPGNSLEVSNSDRCCDVACEVGDWPSCDNCGDGLFNICDEAECSRIVEDCYFGTALIDECLSCSVLNCSDYDDGVDCVADVCGLSCEFRDGSCVEVVDVDVNCSDGVRNQDEVEVDCGGVCVSGTEICGNGLDDDFDCEVDDKDSDCGACSDYNLNLPSCVSVRCPNGFSEKVFYLNDSFCDDSNDCTLEKCTRYGCKRDFVSSPECVVLKRECVDSDGDGVLDYNAVTCSGGRDRCLEDKTVLNDFNRFKPRASGFNLSWNESVLKVENLSGLKIAAEKGGIWFKRKMNLVRLNDSGCYGFMNLDSLIEIKDKNITIHSEDMAELNSSAVLTYVNVSFDKFKVLKNGVECSDCVVSSYNKSNGSLVIEVSGFSSYVIVDDSGDGSSGDDGSGDGGSSTGGSSSGGSGTFAGTPILFGDCVEDWKCGEWGDCVDGKRVRSCSDYNGCGTMVDKPAILGDCSVVEKDEFEVIDVWKVDNDILGWIIVGVFVVIVLLLFSLAFFLSKYLRKRKKRIASRIDVGRRIFSQNVFSKDS